MDTDHHNSKYRTPPARRHYVRVETPQGVWVYWGCDGRDDTSRVQNLSQGGLFIETRKPIVVGAKTQLDFLVQDGQIRAEAVVQYVRPDRGVGLKFTALSEEDRLRLAELMKKHHPSS
jgi:PilZ domain